MKNSSIIASLTTDFLEQFLDHVSGYPEILGAVQAVDPELRYPYLVEQIQQHQPEILLTGWGSVPLPESFLSDCPSIRYICHLTGELRWLMPRSLIEEGLLVTNWGPAISDSVAEGALFLILACCRRATDAVMTMHLRGGWDLRGAPPVSLLDKRVGLHGFGNVAQQLAIMLKPFRCAISAYSPPVPEAIFEASSVRRETDLKRLFEKNDIIVELEALTPSAEDSVGRDLLERIKPGGVFVNAGRGKVVCERDLEQVASLGKIYIGLDVYSQEPLPVHSPLRGLENVFLTPHQAGPTPERYHLCGQHALANIRSYLQGEPLHSIIGTTEYDRMT